MCPRSARWHTAIASRAETFYPIVEYSHCAFKWARCNIGSEGAGGKPASAVLCEGCLFGHAAAFLTLKLSAAATLALSFSVFFSAAPLPSPVLGVLEPCDDFLLSLLATRVKDGTRAKSWGP
jgi:hypothetical protein